MGRHLPDLQILWTWENELGREGVAAAASSLTKLETLRINDNEEVINGVGVVGRLPSLMKLDACTFNLSQGVPEWRIGLQLRWLTS